MTYYDAQDSHEVTDDELETRYDDMLDEVYGDVTVAGLEVATSRALRELDPIAYRVGLSDYVSDLLSDGLLVDELPETRCPACGDLEDYCLGHGEIGDPEGAQILEDHDNGEHGGCDPVGCPKDER